MTLFTLLSNQTLHLKKGQKILKSEEIAQLISLQEIQEKVQIETEEYRKKVEEECILLKKKAEEEGYQEALIRLNEHILHFDAQVKAMRTELMQKMMPLALTAAKKIVAKELELHPDSIVDIVINVLRSVLQNRKVTILVNKQDKEILEGHKAKLKEPFERLEALSIQEHPDIKPGGCVIETETGIIDASLDNQWKALESAFLRYAQKSS